MLDSPFQTLSSCLDTLGTDLLSSLSGLDIGAKLHAAVIKMHKDMLLR